jgi:hypothetical protein
VREEIDATRIDRPIYVTSLPRSGTTILTEMIARQPGVTCHRYSDFPNVWTPYWRNYLLQKTVRKPGALRERAHQDRIKVSNDSPEAVEEVLWMHFFPSAHDEGRSNVLDRNCDHPEFEAYYRDHIRKLLSVRGARRYLAKGNYNVSRLGYLLKLFPDARFLIPVREPVNHIASLMKQHALFLRADGEDRRVSRQLAMAGHFEFGPGRNFVHFGDPPAAAGIQQAWAEGREAEGWASYWAATYSYILDQLERDERLAEACMLFRYEEFCEHSALMIDAVRDHCALESEDFGQIRDEYVQKLSLPDYYQPGFDDRELETIDGICAPVMRRLRSACHKAV